MVEFTVKRLTPPHPPVSEKKNKNVDNLLAMKQILYMGPLILVRWPL